MKETRPQARPVLKDLVKEPPKQTVSPFGVPLKPENVKEARKRENPTVAEKKYDPPEKNVNEKISSGKFSTRYEDKEEAIFNTFELDQQDLEKAVIWSEILAKPKALQKRP
jgi:hypothetical protein